MATAQQAPATTAGAVALENLIQLWMLPMQIGLDIMEKSFAALLGSTAPAEKLVAEASEASETVEAVTRAAEEKLSRLGEEPGETIATPAALTA